MISNQFSPHFDFADALHALTSFALPPVAPPKAQNLLPHVPEAKNYEIMYTNSARVAMRAWILALEIPKSKKIALPAYFCAVGALPFLDLGYDLVWIDVKPDGTMDENDLAFKISKENVGAVVVAHNFGRLADLSAFSQICKPKEIKILTDCAHGWSPQLNFADAAVVSFGREKVLSTVTGGALIWDKNHEDAKVLQNITLQKPSFGFELRHLLQPIVLNIAAKTWPAGKVVTYGAKKLKILPRAVSAKEKKGQWDFEMASMPKSFYRILQRQLNLWTERYNNAEMISDLWISGLNDLKSLGFKEIQSPINKMRVVAEHNDAKKIKKELLRYHIALLDWEGVPISTPDFDPKALGYFGTCPKAEKLSQKIITFPTHQRITPKDVAKTLKLITMILEKGKVR